MELETSYWPTPDAAGLQVMLLGPGKVIYSSIIVYLYISVHKLWPLLTLRKFYGLGR